MSDKLDSSLKKNSGFIRKIRVSLNEATLPSLLVDISTISLEKYLSEVIGALTEGFMKCKSTADIFVGVEVSSALFQRFGTDFTGPLLSNMLKGVANPTKAQLESLAADVREKEVKSRLERQRIIVRIIIELWLVGVFRSTADVLDYNIPSFAKATKSNGLLDPPALAAVKEILSSDLVKFEPVSIAIMIIKNYGSILLGNASLANMDESTPLVSRDMQIKFRKVFSTYASTMHARIKSRASKLIGMEQSNEASFLKTGRVKAEIETEYTELMAETEQMLANCETLYAALDIQMSKIDLTSTKTIKDADGEDKGDWEDDQERQFYEDIIDLAPTRDGEDTQASVPAADDEDDTALIERLEKLKDAPLPKEKEKDLSAEKDEEFKYAEITDDGPAASTDAAETSVNGQRMQEILFILTESPSRDIVDQCARDFVRVNNRASRRKILNHFINMRPSEQHKLPFFARFIATISPLAPDVVPGVIDYLSDYFRYLLRKPFPGLYLTRLYVTRFFSELVKFGLVPKKTTFHLYHACIMKLSLHTTEMLSHLLEGCGRYLFRKSDSHILMVKYLDFLKEQMAKKYLAVESRSMLKNALYYVNPPPKVVIEEKKRSIVEQYIRQLIYIDLDNDNAVEVFSQLMKLDWNDKDTFMTLRKVFCKIWKVKQGNIGIMAKFVQSFKPFYYSFAVLVVDSVLEDIRIGVEQGGYRNNQTRISQVTYLGELCKNKIVDYSVIMSTLYLLLTFGYPNNQPTPMGCLLDPSDELFRIRLACSLLDACGPYLNALNEQNPSKGIGRELDVFMLFLQYFIQCKSGMSVDVEFQVRDTFKLVRPKMHIYTSLETASKALQNAINGKDDVTEEDLQDEEEDGNELTEDDITRETGYVLPEEIKEEETPAERERRLQREERNRIKREERENQQALDEFESEFQKLMLNRFDSSKAKRGTFDAPIPNMKKTEVNYVPGKDGKMPPMPKKVQYTFLTKKANKQEMKEIGLPSESRFVSSVLKEKEERWKMQERIRNIVLRYESEYETAEAKGDEDIEIDRIVQKNIKSSKSQWKKDDQGPDLNGLNPSLKPSHFP